MRGLGIIAAAALWGWACVPDGAFFCEQDGQCSRAAGGVCQAEGRCSYPDDGCESGQRFSDYAGDPAGRCVPVEEASTETGETTDTGEGSGTATGPIPDSCDGVSCSGLGTCVVVDEMATCACEPGLYPVGVSCREDPCDVTACFFVDATDGDDAADGSRETPWKSLGRLMEGLAEAAPGDHFLLRRGRQWEGQLSINNVAGALDVPVVIGAYGPVGEPAPRLLPGAVRLQGSEHVTVRDLWIEDDGSVPDPPNRPCVMMERSEHVVIQDNVITRCINRGVRAHEDTAFTVIVGNEIRDVDQRAGIFVADADWDMATIGPHHWVIDNVITGVPENGITIDASDATADVKVGGNVVADVTGIGIRVTAGGFAWAFGNVVARAGDEAGASGGAMFFDGFGPITGNVLLHSRYGLSVRGEGWVRDDTIVHEGSGPALEITDSARDLAIEDLLVLARGGAPWVVLPADGLVDEIATMDRNWYATDDGTCLLEVMGMQLDLFGFVKATGLDAGSSCAAVPGFGAVPSGLPVDQWDEALWSSLTPDAAWERCPDPAGARGCDGSPRGDGPEPIEEYFESGGLGWPGPLVVRQRYGP